jgi:hypothetical protein
MAISRDLQPVLSAGVSAPAITTHDLEAVVASQYCFRDNWVMRYVAGRRRWLTDEAIDWLLTQGEQALTSSLGEFPQRAEQYAQLAALAAWHHRAERAERLLTQAAENLLSHGWRKDVLFYDVLGAITAYQREQPTDEPRPDDCAVEWLRRLGPPIAQITEFTDGDETRHLPKWLADTMADVAPDLLPVYYQWLADTEEYHDARHALEVLVRTADLSDPVALAVAQTATDDACLQELAKRSRGGDQRAAEALGALMAIMGQAVGSQRPPGSRPTGEPRLGERPRLPPLDQYPPENLSDFFTALREASYWPHEEAVTAWAEHWAARGRGPDTYDVLVDASQRGHTSSAGDAIYRLAAQYRGREDAYNWLVRAYRELNGWNRFVASEERASKYWVIVKANYPTKWAEFLADTILGDVASRGPALGYASFQRLVAYCMMMGQRRLAGEFVEEMVRRSLELVSPLTFPTPGWVRP